MQKQAIGKNEVAGDVLQEDTVGKEIAEETELSVDAEQTVALSENSARQDPANAKLLCL